ncbi:glycosyltransferase [Rhodoligotrophos ferricapiens]|uniref:glycosyltransferase n=1 Tax=Rhodoligotrophos ferricapiens TaxID=3069264 RepID=UPI00315CB34D
MHIITNYTANAGAEAMLSRLLSVSQTPAIVISLMNISDHRRQRTDLIRYEALGMRSPAAAGVTLWRLSRIIARTEPDLIICWMYHALIAGVLAERLRRILPFRGVLTGERSKARPIPVFWNVRQSLDDPGALSRSTRLAVAISKRLSHKAAGIIFNSSRAYALHRSIGFRNHNMVVIPNGFELASPPASIQVRPQLFGIAARFHRQKDHATFFRAAAIVHRQKPAARFVAVGEGLSSDNPEIQALLAEAGLPAEVIDLRGEVADMDPFYREIDVLVLSSRTEGFPNVVAEAMAHGKPVITTDVGDAAAVVGETGIVVPPGDPSALAQAMCGMADISPSDYRLLSLSARRRIEDHYSLPQIARRYELFLGHP